MQECELVEFTYERSKVEAFRYGGKVWFMARGLGYALGMGNIRMIIHRVVPSGEVMRVRRGLRYEDGKAFVDPITSDLSEIQTNGRDLSQIVTKGEDLSQIVTKGEDLSQIVTKGKRPTDPIAISESGLQMVMMRARGVRARAFREWMVSKMPSMFGEVVSSEEERVRPVRTPRRMGTRNVAVFRRANGSEVEFPATELGYVMMMNILEREWWSSDEKRNQ